VGYSFIPVQNAARLENNRVIGKNKVAHFYGPLCTIENAAFADSVSSRRPINNRIKSLSK